MSNDIDSGPHVDHPWTMEDVRDWAADNAHIPDGFPVFAHLPERPRGWARCGPIYTNDLLGLSTNDPEDFE